MPIWIPVGRIATWAVELKKANTSDPETRSHPYTGSPRFSYCDVCGKHRRLHDASLGSIDPTAKPCLKCNDTGLVAVPSKPCPTCQSGSRKRHFCQDGKLYCGDYGEHQDERVPCDHCDQGAMRTALSIMPQVSVSGAGSTRGRSEPGVTDIGETAAIAVNHMRRQVDDLAVGHGFEVGPMGRQVLVVGPWEALSLSQGNLALVPSDCAFVVPDVLPETQNRGVYVCMTDNISDWFIDGQPRGPVNLIKVTAVGRRPRISLAWGEAANGWLAVLIPTKLLDGFLTIYQQNAESNRAAGNPAPAMVLQAPLDRQFLVPVPWCVPEDDRREVCSASLKTVDYEAVPPPPGWILSHNQDGHIWWVDPNGPEPLG